jgi:two-component system, chemotaxis family, chemotaxis protein CheY
MEMKCLIVEDDATSCKLLRMYLSKYGRSFESPNGLLAVEAVQQTLKDGNPFDVIFLDIMMPDMDGHQTLKEIRQLEKEYNLDSSRSAKVIMVTALGDANTILQSFRTGANGFIIKPVREDSLDKEMVKLGLTPVESLP